MIPAIVYYGLLGAGVAFAVVVLLWQWATGALDDDAPLSDECDWNVRR